MDNLDSCKMQHKTHLNIEDLKRFMDEHIIPIARAVPGWEKSLAKAYQSIDPLSYVKTEMLLTLGMKDAKQQSVAMEIIALVDEYQNKASASESALRRKDVKAISDIAKKIAQGDNAIADNIAYLITSPEISLGNALKGIYTLSERYPNNRILRRLLEGAEEALMATFKEVFNAQKKNPKPEITTVPEVKWYNPHEPSAQIPGRTTKEMQPESLKKPDPNLANTALEQLKHYCNIQLYVQNNAFAEGIDIALKNAALAYKELNKTPEGQALISKIKPSSSHAARERFERMVQAGTAKETTR